MPYDAEPSIEIAVNPNFSGRISILTAERIELGWAFLARVKIGESTTIPIRQTGISATIEWNAYSGERGREEFIEHLYPNDTIVVTFIPPKITPPKNFKLFGI